MNDIRQTFCIAAVLAVNAAYAAAEGGDWTISNVGGVVSISTSAVEGDYCRQQPSMLTISCDGTNLLLSVEAGCNPRPRSNGEVDILVTYEFDPGPNRIFDNSSMWIFLPSSVADAHIFTALSEPSMFRRMAGHDTLSFGIEDGTGEIFEQLPTSHFDISRLAQAVKDSGMACGISELIE